MYSCPFSEKGRGLCARVIRYTRLQLDQVDTVVNSNQHVTVADSSKHAVVVGGGWGGFGAAYALLKAGVKVTILDASETPGGLSAGWRTPGGRSVEAGIKGYITLSLHPLLQLVQHAWARHHP